MKNRTTTSTRLASLPTLRLTFGLALGLATVAGTLSACAQSQPAPGRGNAMAAQTAQQSPLITSAMAFLLGQADQLREDNLRRQTRDALGNPETCIRHRADLTPRRKQAIVQALLAAGLLKTADDKTFPGGLLAGVFPPVLDDGTACPHLPQTFSSAPGSDFGSHHSYPGGLALHEANNETAAIRLADAYREVYEQSNAAGAPVFGTTVGRPAGSPSLPGILSIDQDLVVGAPLWHDWAKTIVFQWNADGTESPELNIGGNGATDNYGQAGSSATGAHHILSLAESMQRGFAPAFILTQASAHSAPTLGNEYKVVNWIRAAAIIDGFDPVAKGYLVADGDGRFHLPALRRTGGFAGQVHLLAEYTIHNESDSDYTFSVPALVAVQAVLAKLAPSFGYDAADIARYNNNYRNVVLSRESAERLYILYSAEGTEGVRKEVQRLKDTGKL